MTILHIATLVFYAIAFAFLLATGWNIERDIRALKRRQRR